MSEYSLSQINQLIEESEPFLNNKKDLSSASFYSLCFFGKILLQIDGYQLPLRIFKLLKKNISLVTSNLTDLECRKKFIFFVSFGFDLGLSSETLFEIEKINESDLNLLKTLKYFDSMYSLIQIQNYDNFKLTEFIREFEKKTFSSAYEFSDFNLFYLSSIMKIANEKSIETKLSNVVKASNFKQDNVFYFMFKFLEVIDLYKHKKIDVEIFLEELLNLKRHILPEMQSLHFEINSMMYQISKDALTFSERLVVLFYNAEVFGLGTNTTLAQIGNYMISNDEVIEIENYYEVLRDSPSYIDLIAGVIKTDMDKKLLSEYRNIAIREIIASGDFGIRDIILTEKIFQEENISLKSSLFRTRDIVTQLINSGLPIKRENGVMRFVFEELTMPIFISNDRLRNIEIGRINYLLNFFGTINRSNLEKCFKVSKATANRYLKGWLELGLIKKSSDDLSFESNV